MEPISLVGAAEAVRSAVPESEVVRSVALESRLEGIEETRVRLDRSARAPEGVGVRDGDGDGVVFSSSCLRTGARAPFEAVA